jgi:hypothetical protein
MRVKVGLGPKQRASPFRDPVSAPPDPNFSADKQEDCHPDQYPPAPNEPFAPDSKLCGKKIGQEKEPKTSN